MKVTIDAVPWENLREKCILELASQTGAYDVLYVHPSWFEEFVNNDYLVPVEEYATQEEIDAYVPNLVADYSRNGKAYGLPDFIATQVLAYRTDIFEEKNLKAPESWDELLEVCEALKGSDEYAPITFPGKKGGTLASVFSAFLVSNGGWYRNDAGEPNVNSTEAVETAEFLAKLAQYEPSGYLNVHWDENGKIAAGGKAAMAVIMTINSAWLEDAESSATAGKWAYVPIKSNDGTPGGIVDNYCWSVASDSQNKDAAGAFVEVYHRYRRTDLLHREVKHLWCNQRLLREYRAAEIPAGACGHAGNPDQHQAGSLLGNLGGGAGGSGSQSAGMS